MDFFAPGRTEIIGNHTDHQLGCVIAAAVRQGITAQAEKTADGSVIVASEGFEELCLDSADLEPRAGESGTTAALVRGMLCALQEAGYAVGGFRARLRSTLRPGGGLSSSAAYTVLIGKIISGLYNGGAIDAVTIARCAQRAENRHFGKPSGLMDQLACSVGSLVYVDFLTGEIVPLKGSFADMGLALCLTDTGGSHADLTDAYASIPAEMCAQAGRFGKDKLRHVGREAFYAAPAEDSRAYRRACHFFEENERVAQFRQALEQGDREACLRLMNASGRSSEALLENIRCEAGDDRLERGLARSRELLEGTGAWRVHGGGFAGCVQALLPEEDFERYRQGMDEVFGPGSCFRIM